MNRFLDRGPDGSEFLIMNRIGPPKAPPGYVAVFVEGRWEIIPNSGRFTVGQGDQGRRMFSSDPTKPGILQAVPGPSKPGGGGGLPSP